MRERQSTASPGRGKPFYLGFSRIRIEPERIQGKRRRVERVAEILRGSRYVSPQGAGRPSPTLRLPLIPDQAHSRPAGGWLASLRHLAGRALVPPMTESQDQRREPRFSIVDRALIGSTAFLALIFILLIVTPVTVSAPIRAGEVVILSIALLALLALNFIRVRRTLGPLKRLSAQMERVDLRHPDRIQINGPAESRELATFTRAFNAMLDRLAEERRAGARAAVLAQERERGRIARALHDEAGQTLTAVALEVERSAQPGSEVKPERMAAVAAELHSTLDEIRRIARELRPEALDDLGLVNALIALSSRLTRQSGIPIERTLATDLPPLSEELELVIYRIAQEALTNVLRHSEATRCQLALEMSNGRIVLTVSDNGRGISRSAGNGTIGIEGMRERALLVDGVLAIDSAPGSGTTVRLEAPVQGA